MCKFKKRETLKGRKGINEHLKAFFFSLLLVYVCDIKYASEKTMNSK